MEAESGSGGSRDSLGSLTAAEVLVRSTAARREQPPAGGRGRKVPVAVQRLRAGGSPCPADPAADGAPRAGPARAPGATGAARDSPGAAPGVLNTKAYPERLLPVENSEPMFLSQKDPPKEAAAQDGPLMLLENSRGPEDDVFISQYATGQKEALRAVLMQKTQVIPVHKEVKVQLLGSAASTEKREGAGRDIRSAPREVESATTIAAATAAAIATTAPLLKVQNDLEAKVNSVSELLQKLQETDRQLQRVSEQQKKMKAQHEEPHYQQRVSELEKQMNAFMVQRIQHLEKLQEQQMNIQSHLISSAVNTRGLQQGPVPAPGPLAGHWEKPEQRSLTTEAPSSHRGLFLASAAPAQVFPEAYSSNFPSHGGHTQKSPLKTPVPRRYAPEPVPKNGKISEKENSVVEKENNPKPTREGEGKGLEHVLNSQEAPLKQMEYSKKTALNSNERNWHAGRDRQNALPADLIPSFERYNSIEKTVQKADDLLQDLGKLRREMHNILQEASSWKSDLTDLIKTKSPPVAPDPPEHHPVSKPSILQNVQVPRSILTDAERILRGVQNSKKVLEENLEAVTHAKDGDAMYAFSNSLTTNRDVLEEIRIRRAVDEWIKAINEEMQTEMARSDSEQGKYDQKAPWNKRAQNLRAVKTKKETKEKTENIPGCLPKKLSPPAQPLQKQVEDNTRKQKFKTYFSEDVQSKERKADGAVGRTALVQNEDYLSQIYGKPIYQGRRSTLKKEPYLRFTSPSPKSKLPRPKLIETVRGTKVKSARTQTCSHTHKIISSPRKKNPVYAPAQQSQYLFSPSQDVPAASGPLEGHLIPMAIPLGQTQSSNTSVQPAGVIIDKPHPVTVTTSLPPVPPKPPVEVKKPNIAVIEMRSEKKEPPQLSVQVLPNVDIDSVSSASGTVSPVPPSSEPLLPPVNAVIQTPEEIHSEEEDTKLPGVNFIDVTDVTQDQEEEKDEIPEFLEPVLELNGQFKVASPQHNGPLFPPVASAPQQPADILDELIQKRETIENKLVNWVEQEIMAKIISEMCPAQAETVPSISSSIKSEDSEVVTPGIVEVAGGGGFQLFVNAGVPVDSEMINHFVKEALSETIATMLGDSQAQRAVPDPPPPPPSTTSVMEAPLPTPVPTPQATPPPTPPPEKELPEVKTPDSSPSPPEMSGDVHGHEKIKETGVESAAATGCVVTPVVTPVATPDTTPPPVATPSPPVSEWGSQAEKRESPKLPNPWDGAELPLEEENPSPVPEEPFCPETVEMSVANDEEPEALVFPPQQLPGRPLEALPCPAQVPSPVPTVSSGVSSQESSLTPTGTETTDRPLSEGEVLFPYGHPLPAAALAEGGISLPNLAESLSSTLQDANEMDYDPPSEGQVVRRMGKGYHRDPVLALLTKLNQAPVFVQERIEHSEDSDGSIGELSAGQRPRLSRAQERILMGNSIFMEHPAAQSCGNRPRQGLRSASPGQLTQIGEILEDADTSPSPMLLAELESQPGSNPALPAAQPSCRRTALPEDLSQEESQGAAHVQAVRPRVVFVRRKSEEMQQEGEDAAPHLNAHLSAARVSVQLPGTSTDNETQSLSSARGDSDSSGTDTF
ncbi:protein TALPID3 isoform X2 [Motacilla alba alba]|uniref:protein TALPID3 isoform X2 n=1 Tax=Motacilla alba alba TaxID=1094192 RepID=UPI0018D4DF78|nr:protein TALPID3 isoform X2 [Motacilla alba alba]